MAVDGLIEVEELLCSSPLDPVSESSELATGELLRCGLLGRGEIDDPKSEGAVFEVVGRRILGETGEVMLATGEKLGWESWRAFRGTIWPRWP